MEPRDRQLLPLAVVLIFIAFCLVLLSLFTNDAEAKAQFETTLIDPAAQRSEMIALLESIDQRLLQLELQLQRGIQVKEIQ